MLEGKLLVGEQRGGLDRLAQQAAAQLSWQQAELRKQQEAEAEAARRIAALEADTHAVQTHTLTLQVGAKGVCCDGKRQQYGGLHRHASRHATAPEAKPVNILSLPFCSWWCFCRRRRQR